MLSEGLFRLVVTAIGGTFFKAKEKPVLFEEDFSLRSK